jgi:hypothetical protein
MSDAGEPKRDFERMLDLNRSTLIRDFVDEMEARVREIDTAQVAQKDIVEAAKRQEFTPSETAAMKKIARLRMKDKKAQAQQELEALERIGIAVDFNVMERGER